MIKFIVNIVEIIIVAKILWKIIKFTLLRRFFKKKQRKGKSAFQKIYMYFNRKLHSKLDKMILKQTKELNANKTNETDTKTKVINIKNYERQKIT